MYKKYIFFKIIVKDKNIFKITIKNKLFIKKLNFKMIIKDKIKIIKYKHKK